MADACIMWTNVTAPMWVWSERIRPYGKIPILVQEWVNNNGRMMTCAIRTMNATAGVILFYIFGIGRVDYLSIHCGAMGGRT